MARRIEAHRWSTTGRGLQVLLLLGTISAAWTFAHGQAPAPDGTDAVMPPADPATPARVAVPDPGAVIAIEPPAVDLNSNPGGDIEFQRGIGKFPNGPLEPKRDAREAEGGPLGYTHTVPAVPTEPPPDEVPEADRWRVGFPAWDRFVRGLAVDSYHQNVFKGDYPICGTQDIFFNVTALADNFVESRELPVKGGNQNQSQYIGSVATTLDLFKGDNSFHPSEWTVQATPFFQLRDQSFDNTHNAMVLQDAFVDVQLKILSDYYDQVNLRVGRQAFATDFRGFVFNDTNDGIRLFGNAVENRVQYNVYAFDMVQKDQVTQLNSFDARQQQVYGANAILQDPASLWGLQEYLGLNILGGITANHDCLLNTIDTFYLELAADGRIGRVNVNAAFIQEFGHDTDNPVAKRPVDINAQMAELELVYPLDWFFPKVSFLYASGDHNPTAGTATGFDGIFDNPNFAGAAFSYFQREAPPPGGTALKNQFTFYPDLRNKFFQPSNAVNPGLLLLNTGFDARLTSRIDLQMNFNYYEMVDTASVELLSKIPSVGKDLGFETNMAFVYKPFAVDNVQFTVGASALVPGDGLKDLNKSSDTLYTFFFDLTTFY